MALQEVFYLKDLTNPHLLQSVTGNGGLYAVHILNEWQWLRLGVNLPFRRITNWKEHGPDKTSQTR